MPTIDLSSLPKPDPRWLTADPETTTADAPMSGSAGDASLAGGSSNDRITEYGGQSPVAAGGKSGVSEYGGSNPFELRSSDTGKGPLPTIKNDGGLGFGERAALGIKMTPEGKAGFLESRYGAGNVVSDNKGDFYVRKDGKDWARVDPKGFESGDLADFAGMAVEAVPTLAAGTNPLTVAGAAAAGNAVRQGVSALLPGDDKMTAGQRVGDVALSAGLAGGTQAGVNAVLGRAADYVRPHNVVARHVERQLDRPAFDPNGGPPATRGAQADQIAADLGPDFPGFSPGQASQSRAILTMEGLARRNPASADAVQQFDDAQLNFLHRRTLRMVDTMRGVPLSGPMVTGQAVEDAFRGSVNRALTVRRTAAARDFGALETASNGQAVIPVQSTLGEIDSLIREFDVPGGGDASAALVNRLQALRQAWAGQPERTAESAVLDSASRPITTTTPAQPHQITGEQAQRLLQIYTNAAQGSGRLFQDIDSGQQRLIARRVLNAFGRDLDQAADAGGQGGAVSDALRTARANYRTNSQAIDGLEESVLGRMFGGEARSPEAITKQMLRMEPTELRASFAILDQHDPSVAQRVKAQFFEDALHKAGAPRAQTAPRGQTLAEEFSAAKMVTALRQSQVWDVLTVPERAEASTIFRGLQRIARREGEGSPTAPLQFAMDIAKGFMGGLTSPTQMIGTAASVMGPRRIAEAMADPVARRQLVTLTQNAGFTGAGARKAEAAAAYLAAWSAKEPSGSNIRPYDPATNEQSSPDPGPPQDR